MRTKLSTLLRAGGALAALLAITLGVPWALARVAGWPLPTTWPHLDRLPDVLRDGLSDGFWIKAIALVVWLAWAQVIIAVGAEVVARVRGRSSDRRRGLGWAQAVAGQLVGALAVAGGLVGSAPHAIAAPAPSLASTLVAVAGPPPAAPSTMAPVALAAPVQHVVVRGESLSSIARDELGQAAAWPTLWDANQGRVFGERVFDDPNLILPGWDLAVPQPAVLIPPLVLSAADEHVPAGPMPVVAPPTTPPAAVEHAAAPAPDSAVAAPDRRHHGGGGRRRGRSADLGRSGRSGGAPAWTQLGVLLGSTLLATGAAGMIASARRRSLRASATTSTVVAPEPEVARGGDRAARGQRRPRDGPAGAGAAITRRSAGPLGLRGPTGRGPAPGRGAGGRAGSSGGAVRSLGARPRRPHVGAARGGDAHRPHRRRSCCRSPVSGARRRRSGRRRSRGVRRPGGRRLGPCRPGLEPPRGRHAGRHAAGGQPAGAGGGGRPHPAALRPPRGAPPARRRGGGGRGGRPDVHHRGGRRTVDLPAPIGGRSRDVGTGDHRPDVTRHRRGAGRAPLADGRSPRGRGRRRGAAGRRSRPRAGGRRLGLRGRLVGAAARSRAPGRGGRGRGGERTAGHRGGADGGCRSRRRAPRRGDGSPGP